MNPTTAHSSEVLSQLVLIDVDQIRQRVKHAIRRILGRLLRDDTRGVPARLARVDRLARPPT